MVSQLLKGQQINQDCIIKILCQWDHKSLTIRLLVLQSKGQQVIGYQIVVSQLHVKGTTVSLILEFGKTTIFLGERAKNFL